ncbi:uncharacterized protein SPPG_04485 [Spizellomyces punctatus DAOM BR117]|uniref:Ubiquitin-like domain-containing protein n=1 Tax=Spizellomyces punctatus (strain DAOM BR117) TaxID=645134 RepID=A0A0L0HH84_SPIPD|nr:uncharacterized protein SPPG_04485 [Spizellomyces punctatus DAOM BR117]KND00144.1 hypothetical protein SPPG_04485 [Spizellomyces punctatus DAOM BR117]|eukprot:XP_016608183.1 hypothetical protein SPPG_04485 [Spizellomyces punctatus DAOM BR117]
MASMYLRVKRQKTTWFVEAQPQDTVQQLKTKLATTLNREKDAKDLRLQVPGKQPGTYSPLDDTAVLEQIGLVDDAVVYLSFWIAGQSNPSDGKWEPVEVPDFEPLNDEEGVEEGGSGKGKAAA